MVFNIGTLVHNFITCWLVSWRDFWFGYLPLFPRRGLGQLVPSIIIPLYSHLWSLWRKASRRVKRQRVGPDLDVHAVPRFRPAGGGNTGVCTPAATSCSQGPGEYCGWSEALNRRGLSRGIHPEQHDASIYTPVGEWKRRIVQVNGMLYSTVVQGMSQIFLPVGTSYKHDK